jgi:hypothetical protein
LLSIEVGEQAQSDALALIKASCLQTTQRQAPLFFPSNISSLCFKPRLPIINNSSSTAQSFAPLIHAGASPSVLLLHSVAQFLRHRKEIGQRGHRCIDTPLTAPDPPERDKRWVVDAAGAPTDWPLPQSITQSIIC